MLDWISNFLRAGAAPFSRLDDERNERLAPAQRPLSSGPAAGISPTRREPHNLALPIEQHRGGERIAGFPAQEERKRFPQPVRAVRSRSHEQLGPLYLSEQGIDAAPHSGAEILQAPRVALRIPAQDRTPVGPVDEKYRSRREEGRDNRKEQKRGN